MHTIFFGVLSTVSAFLQVVGLLILICLLSNFRLTPNKSNIFRKAKKKLKLKYFLIFKHFLKISEQTSKY